MSKLIALAQFLLALSGCSLGAETWSHRVAGNGGESLRSDIVAEDGIARFRCLASASGACHYTLYPAGCRNADCRTLGHKKTRNGAEGRTEITGVFGIETAFQRPSVGNDIFLLFLEFLSHGHIEHETHKVHTGDKFCNAVFHLKPRIHFKEVIFFRPGVENKLYGACRGIIDFPHEAHRGITNFPAQFR